MKTFVLLAAAGLVAAQFEGLPSCATKCATQLLSSSGCNNDARCICANKTFIQDISCCLAVPGGCGAEDQAKAVVFAGQLCSAYGVSVPTVVSCPSLSASASTASATATATGSAAASSASSASSSGTRTSAAASAAATTTTAATGPAATAGPVGLMGSLLGGLIAAAALL